MKAKAILEPREVDLVIAGGDFSDADLKELRALLKKSKAEIEQAQAYADAQPWIAEPIPTFKQLIALQEKREAEEQRNRAPLPEGIIDIDESGIGGSPTPEESAYISAYIWSTRSRIKNTETSKLASVFKEPAPRYKAAARPKPKTRKK